jgi:predicted house-cleaning noncanonical NTP pyrophosphatase (MazG superfamily)
MARGAYLSQERRNLFEKLGEDVYYKIQKGELRNTELSDVVKQVDRITKKLEVSEIKIRSIRFGKRVERPTLPQLEETSGEPL